MVFVIDPERPVSHGTYAVWKLGCDKHGCTGMHTSPLSSHSPNPAFLEVHFLFCLSVFLISVEPRLLLSLLCNDCSVTALCWAVPMLSATRYLAGRLRILLLEFQLFSVDHHSLQGYCSTEVETHSFLLGVNLCQCLRPCVVFGLLLRGQLKVTLRVHSS